MAQPQNSRVAEPVRPSFENLCLSMVMTIGYMDHICEYQNMFADLMLLKAMKNSEREIILIVVLIYEVATHFIDQIIGFDRHCKMLMNY